MFIVMSVCHVISAEAQSSTVTFVYDDLGRLSRVIDTATGTCAAYEYDAVGNIVSIGRDANCVAVPSVTGISPATTQNCFVIAGQNLRGSTVRADIPGVSTTGLVATPTAINFCLSTEAPVCSISGTVTVTTPGGSTPALPVTITGRAQWPGATEFTDAVGTANRSDRFCFALPAAQRIILQATASDFDSCLRLTTEAGSPVAGGSVCAFPAARLDLVLPAGSYSVEISDNGNNQVGAYTAVYEPIVAATATPLLADVAATESILPTGDLDLFMFTLTASTRVILQATSFALDPCVRVLTAAGDPPVTGGTACAFPSARLDLVLAAGTYFVELSDNGNTQAGDYTLLFEPIETTAAVPLTPDVLISQGLDPLGDLDLYSFTLTTATRVVLQTTTQAFFPCLRILTGAGNPPVANGSSCSFPVSRLDLVLPAGTYFAEVSDNGSNLTGSYSVIYEPIVAANAAVLAAAVPTVEPLTPVGDLDLYTFTLASSTRVVLQATSSAMDPCLRLWPAEGPPVAGGLACGFPSARLDLTLAAGTYVAEVSDSGGTQGGAYTVLYYPVLTDVAVPLVAGADVGDAVSVIGDLNLYSFALAGPTRVILQATSQGIDPCVRVLTAAGEPPVANGTACGFPAARLDVTLGAGVYFVEVSDNGNTQTGSYTLIFEPVVTAIATPLLPAVAVAETIAPLGDLDLYTFTLPATTRVVLQSTSSLVFTCVRLLTGAGGPVLPAVQNCGFPAARLERELAAGTYFVELSVNGNNATGAYGLSLETDLAGVPTVTVAATDPTASELGLDPGIFTFTRTGSTAASLAVSFTVSGTAGPADFLGFGNTVIIPGGAASTTVQVSPFPDAEREPQETVVVTLASGNYTIGTPATATVTIADDGAPIILSVLTTTPTIVESGPEPGTFTIVRNGPLNTTVTVNLTLGGTATPGVDYANVPTSLVMGPGEMFAAVTIVPVADGVAEAAETVTLAIAPGDYTVGTGAGTASLTITDAVAPTSVYVLATLPTAFEEGGLPAMFTVVRVGSTAESLTVNLGWSGAATRGVDYEDPGTTVVIPAGEQEAGITISPILDGLMEGQESVIVTIAPGDYAVIDGAGTATAAILDGEERPLVYVLATDAEAGESGANSGTWFILRTGSFGTALTVTYELGGTATSGSDYQTLPSSVVIPAGQVFAQIELVPIADAVAEGTETVTLTLTPGAYDLVDLLRSATITITETAP